MLGQLAKPTLNDTIRIRYPEGDDAFGLVTIEGDYEIEPFDIEVDYHLGGRIQGVRIAISDREPQFFPLPEGVEQIPDAARVVREFLRDEALVSHPTLLTAEAEGFARPLLAELGLPGREDIIREAEVPARVRRRLAHRGGAADLFPTQDTHRPVPPVWPEISWPQNVEEMQAAVEAVLTLKYSGFVIDDDDDYVIEEGDSRFYLTVINDRPIIAFRKTAVIWVKSRQAAVIEANYLNRDNTDIRWVLRGHTLSQELLFTTAPFVPSRFVHMLEHFAEQYRGTVSALRMRLGGDD
jgi:hypothetical protein